LVVVPPAAGTGDTGTSDTARSGPAARSGGEPLVGRDEELRTVDECAAAVRSGRPHLVVVDGEPGAGRTAFARAVARRLHDFLVVWLTGRSDEQAVPFGIADQTVAALHRFAAEQGISLPHQRLDPYDVRARADQLLGVVDASQRRQPTLLVLDDAHYSDEKSLACFGYLASRLHTGRLLLLVTRSRPGAPADAPMAALGTEWLRGYLGSTALTTVDLRLPPLGWPDLVRLANHVTGQTADARLTERLIRFSGGNARLARILIDGADADNAAGGQGVPPSLLTGVRSRLATLPAPALSMLEALAVLGGPARMALVAQVAGVSEHVGSLEVLLERGLVRWLPEGSPVVIAISDPLVADSTYQLLSPRRRQELHAAAERLVGGEERWRHRVSAAVGLDPRLVTELTGQARAAFDRGQAGQAVRYLRWAADLSDSKADHDEALLSAAVIELWDDRAHDDADLESVIAAADPSALRSCALGLLHSRDLGRADEAEAWLVDALERRSTGDHLPRWLTLLAATALAHVEVLRGDTEAAIRYAEAVLENSADAHPSVLVRAVRALTFATLTGRGTAPAVAELHAAEDGLVRGGRIAAGDHAFDFPRSVLSLYSGSLTTAVTLARTALDASANPAGDRVQATATLVLAAAQHRLGSWSAARKAVDAALQLVESRSVPELAVAPTYLMAAVLAAESGRWARAEHHTAQLAAAPGVDLESRLLFLAIAQATVARTRGDYAAVLTAFDEIRHVLEAMPENGRLWAPATWWRPLLAEGLVEVGELDLARRELRRIARLAEQAPQLRMTVLWLSGRLAERSGDRRQAQRYYEQAVTLTPDRDDAPMSRAQAELAFGTMLRETGDRRRAVLWLRRARQRFLRLGATPFVERCEALLTAADPVAPPHRADLTERERQVASLVAENLTNNEVAARLFVSEKTVEYHLSHVFVKLGISSRRQLRTMRHAFAPAPDA
jgi:DNA-binding NarL/FixJ family response regulator